MADTPVSLRAIEALKKWRPASVRMHLADGHIDSIAVPEQRKKWVQVQAVLEKSHWYRLEAMSKKGELLGIVENDEPAGDLEDIGETATTGESARLLQLMLSAQDHALDRQTKLIDTMLQNNLALSKVLMSRLDTLENSHGAMLEAMRELMTGDELSSGDAIAGMLAAVAQSKIVTPKPAPKPNGKK